MSRIVVGVDGSDGGTAALRWALREARARGARVEAVTAWQMPAWFVLEAGGRRDLSGWADALEDKARTVQERSVRAATSEETRVPVDKVVVREGAAKALVHIAEGAALLVVGARGSGGLAGLRLGSVSDACVAHAPCPVVVVHPDTPPAGSQDRRADLP